MANGLVKKNTIIGLAEESTEGTFAAPAAATLGNYLQAKEDGFELNYGREVLDRGVLTSGIGIATPRLGLKESDVSLPLEYKASGTEGEAPEANFLLKNCLGNRRQVTSNVPLTGTPTTSTFTMSAPNSALFAVGDMVVCKVTGSHSVHVITAVASGVLTYSPVRAVAPVATDTLSKCTTYYPANSGHTALSVSFYDANTVRRSASGCKVNSMAVENFTVGQIPSMNFGLQGLSFNEIDGAAPHTPVYAGLPPIVLGACLYVDGVVIQLESFSLSVENEIGFIVDTCSSSGRVAARMTKRTVTGSINPYKDDTSVANFTKFNNLTTFALFGYAAIPSSTAGEFTMGSVVSFYLPTCMVSELNVGDVEGILTDEISFSATGGTDGSSNEIYLGYI